MYVFLTQNVMISIIATKKIMSPLLLTLTLVIDLYNEMPTKLPSIRGFFGFLKKPGPETSMPKSF